MRRACIAAIVLGVSLCVGTSTRAAENPIGGRWTLTVETLPLRLELSQDGRDVTGTLDYPHGAPFHLTGSFADGTLRFTGDSAGENFTIHITATARLIEDGSLAGRITAHIIDLDEHHNAVRTHDDEMTWTAVHAK